MTRSSITGGSDEMIKSFMNIDAIIEKTCTYLRTEDNIVYDFQQTLIWQDDTAAKTVTKPWLTQTNYDDCANGDTSACSDSSGDTAATYCSNLNLGEYTDWRLPTISELEGIVDTNNYPMIDSHFMNINAEYGELDYWSSTDTGNLYGYATFIDFFDAYVYTNTFTKDMTNWVRCVRGVN